MQPNNYRKALNMFSKTVGILLQIAIFSMIPLSIIFYGLNYYSEDHFYGALITIFGVISLLIEVVAITVRENRK